MLTENQQKVCLTLFQMRGMTAALLTKYFYRSFVPTYSNEKYMYSILNKLKAKGYVNHSPVHHKGKNISFYYLTPKGLEYVKAQLNIQIGQNGNGLLPQNERTTYWDIPYEYYKPPIKQVDHFIQLLELLHNFYVFDLEDVYFNTS